jgi:hypothetical protein
MSLSVPKAPRKAQVESESIRLRYNKMQRFCQLIVVFLALLELMGAEARRTVGILRRHVAPRGDGRLVSFYPKFQ